MSRTHWIRVSVSFLLILLFQPQVAAAGLDADLNKAAKKGDLEKIRSLLAMGANPDTCKGLLVKTAALGQAVRAGRSDAAKLLIQSGANINQSVTSCPPPIYWAARECMPDMLELLISGGADINLGDVGYQQSPLYLASAVGCESVVQELIQAAADLDRQTNENGTALMTAAARGHARIVRVLLEAGADHTLYDSSGQTALTYAEEGRHGEVVGMLRNALAAPQSASGSTAPRQETMPSVSGAAGDVITSPGKTSRARKRYAQKIEDEKTGATLSFLKACPAGNLALLYAGSDRAFEVDVWVQNTEYLLSDEAFYNMAHSAIEKVRASCEFGFTRIALTVDGPSFRSPAAHVLYRQGAFVSLETGNPKIFVYDNYAGAEALRHAFWKRNGVQSTPSAAEVIGNPFSWEQKIVALPLTFVTMETRSTGRFGGEGGELLVEDIPSGIFSSVGQRAYVAGRVLGKKALAEINGRFAALQFKDAVLCRFEDCGIILAVRPGETIRDPLAAGNEISLRWPLDLPGGSFSDRLWPACGADYEVDKRHLGADLPVSSETPVYPLAGGKVFEVSTSGWGDGNVAVVLEHTIGGSSFLAVYGHVLSSLTKGQVVDGERPLGRIGTFLDPNGDRADHLHLGIHPGCCPALDGQRAGWGRKTDKDCSSPNDTNGFVAPVAFLRNLGLS